MTTERITAWITAGLRRSEDLGRLRSAIANELVSDVDPPPDVADHMEPFGGSLIRWGVVVPHPRRISEPGCCRLDL